MLITLSFFMVLLVSGNNGYRPKSPTIGIQLEVMLLINRFLLWISYPSSPLFGASGFDNYVPHISPPFCNVICLLIQAVTV